LSRPAFVPVRNVPEIAAPAIASLLSICDAEDIIRPPQNPERAAVGFPDCSLVTISLFKMTRSRPKRRYVTRSSVIHGKGVFATGPIRKGTRIIEYRGARSTMEVACERPLSDPANPHHTFIFELSDGTVIDAGLKGNAARWINHSCDPNCETVEGDGRLFIHAIRPIRAGEELTYDYRLSWEGPLTVRTLKAHSCGCGTAKCRGSMLLESSGAA
jgi:uncharacterized protein